MGRGSIYQISNMKPNKKHVCKLVLEKQQLFVEISSTPKIGGNRVPPQSHIIPSSLKTGPKSKFKKNDSEMCMWFTLKNG